MNGKLAGRKVLVTGAASGRARDIAGQFAAAGAHSALPDQRRKLGEQPSVAVA